MDDITDSVGKLSTKAKEWTPGQSFGSAAPTNVNSIHSRTSSSNTDTNPWRSVSSDSGISDGGTSNKISQFNVDAAHWSPSKVSFENISANNNNNNNNKRSTLAESETETSIPTGNGLASKSSTFTSNNPIAPPMQKSLHSLGLPSHTLWAIYREMAMDCAREMDPNDPLYKAIPQAFSNAIPLENEVNQSTRSSFGYHASVFKVVSREDGRLYCLRRLDNVKGVNQKIASTVTQSWLNAVQSSQRRTSKGDAPHVLSHPGIVRFMKCFHIVHNRAVFFLHEYHPASLTLRETLYGLERGAQVNQTMLRNGFSPLPEATVWSYITQLASAIRAVHRGNLACRSLQLNHILVSPDVGSGVDENAGLMGGYILKTNRVRLRINCLGVVDALEFEARRSIQELQIEDMRCLGRIILSLCYGFEVGPDTSDDHLTQGENFVRHNYSEDLYTLVVALLARPQQGRFAMQYVEPPHIGKVCRAIADHAFDELDSAHAVVDGLDEALASEYESGRALRLLLKLGFINERPEFGYDTRWSESGDSYILKLFRDYVFHQADSSGRPIMDLGHVVTALNKLDAGDDEKIVLTSRNGKSVIVVTYADVARCLENSYHELCSNSVSLNQQGTQVKY